MLIPCPSCGQNNPQNAKQCLHCNHRLTPPDPGGFKLPNMNSPAGRTTEDVSKNPVYQIASMILLAVFAAVFFYGMKYGRETICVVRHDDRRISELEVKGYTCELQTFGSPRNRQKRVRCALTGGNNRRILEVCCVEPEAESPQP